MADTGLFRVPHQVWQRANVNAAAAYLREVLAADPANTRVSALHEGLLDVLDPRRRAARQQRELARIEIPLTERRRHERRGGGERRVHAMERPAGTDRRLRQDRRTGQDRRRP
jgi:hypothetical protein